MPAPISDPLYIKNKEAYFIEIAKTLAKASSHPVAPSGCVIVRDREIIGDGRGILTGSKIEIDCISVAIGASSKRGTPTVGATIYSTRYPFTTPVFQCYQMGISKIVVLAHEWEPFYKDEFRRAARLSHELQISIETYFDTQDERFGGAPQSPKNNPFQTDDYDPQHANDIPFEDAASL